MNDEGDGGTPDWAAAVAAARRASRAQRSLWQQLPYRALQAVRPGEGALELTMAEGYWPLGAVDMVYTAYVDCATGEIVDAEDPSQPAPDLVVEQLLGEPGQLDPRRILAALDAKIRERGEHDPWARWRATVTAELGLRADRPFTREGVGGDGLA